MIAPSWHETFQQRMLRRRFYVFTSNSGWVMVQTETIICFFYYAQVNKLLQKKHRRQLTTPTQYENKGKNGILTVRGAMVFGRIYTSKAVKGLNE